MNPSIEPAIEVGNELSEEELSKVVGGLDFPWIDVDEFTAPALAALRDGSEA